ncbi:MAG: hypothetical protein V7K71_03820 [Nostoc sp.]|uniref:hypothetical protein n=1 Tax=Nostoc sp. TaxID=1180 RepID=UPI002FF68E88
MSATGNSWKRCAIAPRKYKRRKIKRGRGAIALELGGYAIAQTINSVKTTNKVVIMSVLDKYLDFLRNDALIHDDSQSKLASNTNEPSVDSTM